MKKYFSMAGILACVSAGAMAAQSASIEEIVVEAATKSEQKLKDITSNVEVITSDEIEQRHYHSVIEALSSLGGVNFTQSGGTGQQSALYLRGMSNKYTLVVVDGIRMNDVTSFEGAFFDQLPIGDIERIEVIKGAQSGIWGADATAGVINIVTKKAKPHHVSLYGEMGSFGTKKYGLTFAHVMSKGDIKFGFDRLITDGISSAEPKRSNPLYGQRFDNLGWEKDKFLSTTLFGKGGINLTDSDRIEFYHRHLSSDFQYDSTGGVDNVTNENSFQQRFSNISYVHNTEKNSLKLYGDRSDFKRAYYGGYRGQIAEMGVLDTLRYGSKGILTTGATMQIFDLGSAGGTIIERSYTGRAIFATNTNLLNDEKTILTQNIRYDNYTLFGSKMTGKVGVKQFVGDLSISSNYGTAFQAPNLAQMAPPLSWGMTPNYDLKPENIRSFDLSGSYKNMSLTYFYNTIKDMIASPSWTVFENLSGTSTLQGYETKLKFNPFESVLTTVSYTKLRAVDGNGKDLERRPHDVVTTTVDWYPTSKLHVGTLISYVGERYDNSAKTVSTGGYTVVNGTISYELSSQMGVYMKLDNLFDRYYQTVDGYATAGRSAYVGMKASF